MHGERTKLVMQLRNGKTRNNRPKFPRSCRITNILKMVEESKKSKSMAIAHVYEMEQISSRSLLMTIIYEGQNES